MSDDHHGAKDPLGPHLVSRMLFFSDAVFAIVLTLLVLELRPPPSETDLELGKALLVMAPKFYAFAGSFALVSVFWLAHMSITRRMKAFDWPVSWANLVFLFTIAVMPFATSLIGEHGTVGLSWRIYCAALVAVSLTATVLLMTLVRDKGRLVGEITRREVAWRVSRSLSPGVAFAIGLGLSIAGHPALAGFCWVLIPLEMLVARLALGPRDTPPLPPMDEMTG
ncbi:hypothetical protein BH11PSE2_BH11PSE2_03200 [soil metagenome]